MLPSTIYRLCPRAEQTSRFLFHTSAVLASKKSGQKNGSSGKRGSSRTRLTDDLREKPGLKNSNLEVAPRSTNSTDTRPSAFGRSSSGRRPPRKEFPRDALPHADLGPVTASAMPAEKASFRRGRQNSRSGKWGREDGFSSKRFPQEDARGREREQRSNRDTNRYPRKHVSNVENFMTDRGHRDEWTRKPSQLEENRFPKKQFSERQGFARDDRQTDDRKGQRSSEQFSERQGFAGDNQRTDGRKGQRASTQDQHSSPRRNSEPHAKPNKPIPVISELSDANTTTHRPSPDELATEFTSPPLMPGILSCLTDVIGPNATPTPIQALSLKWLLNGVGQVNEESGWKQFLLASETGSGKSIAYLLPVLQNLKLSELNPTSKLPLVKVPVGPKRALNPRALILAPTHELARQLSGFAKSLLHEVKLRVLCASRANMKSTKERDATARQMVAQVESDEASGEFELKERSGFPVDVVVGTPMKLLEMVKGRGWDRKEVNPNEPAEESEEDGPKPRRGRDKMFGFGKWRSKPEMGLANVEWVVVDEADVLFDPDFQETTRQLLADISKARGYPIPPTPVAPLTPHSSPTPPTTLEVVPHDYPFNFILTSATIPASLATYLDTHHPKLMRLASPRLHHLPKTLQTEYVNWSGGNKLADIERRIRRVWAEDSSTVGINGDAQRLSKVLIFCNRSSKVDELGTYLEERGIKNIGLSSTSEHRKRGSNHHLDGFLRGKEMEGQTSVDVDKSSPVDLGAPIASDPKSQPHVMITTSLLSRGLDFSPSIRHVFIVDEPRNMIDFLHRAGRAGRAGERGKVVVFGKMKGRGSSGAKDVRKKVGSLISR